MGMFYCSECDGFCDSHDGCVEGPNYSLICGYCAEELELLSEHKEEQPE